MRIVLDPTGMRRAASRIDDAAAEAAMTATRLTATSLPTMPPSVAALVSDAVATTQRTARAASLELHDLASELRLRARLGELAGDGNGWPSVLRTSGAWLGEGPSGIFGQAGLAWALVAGWDGYHLADSSDSVVPFATRFDKPHHGSGLIGDLEKAAKVVKSAGRAAIDVVAVVPYAGYYGAYQAAKAINDVGAKAGPGGSVVAHLVAAPLAIPEATGLVGDATLDVIKGESVRDEQVRGYINPMHSFVPSWLKGPQVYLPGIGKRGVDFKW
jgi:hypothetical protein